jgi:hypothetical protein
MELKDRLIRHWKKFMAVMMLAAWVSTLVISGLPAVNVNAQQPTGSVPTVTGTPPGPFVTVYSDQVYIDVYPGPSMYDYDPVGVLVAGERAPALGFSLDGNWIQIVYLGIEGGKGWVYGPLVSITGGNLPKLAAPPTATPRTTPTLDPTNVAAYGLNLEPTRLPTFTPPPPLIIPTFTPAVGNISKVPYGLWILILALVGILGAVISFLRGNH